MKTIAENMIDILRKNECKAVMFGDVHLLDEAADRCTHTNLMKLHPMERHRRMLTACERSGLFVKRFIAIDGKGSGRGNHRWRCLFIKGMEPK